MRKGEGALLPLVLFLIYVFDFDRTSFFIHALVGFVALALMYALNDIHDAPFDLHDEVRKSAWVEALAQKQKVAYIIHALQLAFFIGVLIFYLKMTPLIVAAAFTISTAYNLWGKKIRFLGDILVLFWGPTFTLLLSVKIPIFLVANTGFMLLMGHTFQMARDSHADAKNDIRTTWVVAPRWAVVIFYIICIAAQLCFAFGGFYAAAFAVTSFYLVPLFGGYTQKSWLILKFLQASSWLLILV
ncbi:MAG TPA: UbiA family prenyltransferase [Turneriella sp.]|nr:UbiA family prenyltransferase [Turneriella sp.]